MKKIITIFAILLALISSASAQNCISLTSTFFPKTGTPGAVNDSLALNIVSCPNLPTTTTYLVYSNGLLVTSTSIVVAPGVTTGSTKVAVLPATIYLFQVKNGDGTCFSNFVSWPGTTLAVKLVSFEGTYENGDVKISWKTESDADGLRYEVERSLDGQSFLPVSSMPALGNTGSVLYSYVDHTAKSSTVYNYRLKIVNKDGKIEYSKTVVVRTKANQMGGGVYTFPNPVTTSVDVRIDDKLLPSTAKIQISDMSGRLLLSTSAPNSKVDLSSLTPGVYTLKVVITTNGITQNATTKIIKQ